MGSVKACIALCMLNFIGNILCYSKVPNKVSEIVVQTKNGPVQGIIQHSRDPSVEYISFMALRYADPARRFEPPKPLTETWTTPKIAKTHGTICLQPWLGGSDDCLYLNIHAPSSALKDASKRLPVMFWIHGGGFTFGAGHSYGVKNLMENENVIVVSINYRLALFGFLAMENDTSIMSNNGLRDMVQALKWVQQNIEAFHGNPNKVTIWGESAGSAAVNYILMSPLAKDLFHGAIMQSGAHSFWSYSPDPRQEAIAFAKHFDCSKLESGKDINECLENQKGVKLVGSELEYSGRWPPHFAVTRFLPTAKEVEENAFFSTEPSPINTVDGKQNQYPNKVPVIIGFNRDEGSMFTAFVIKKPEQLEQLNKHWNNLAPKALSYDTHFPKSKLEAISRKVREYYFGSKPISMENLDSLVNLYTDSQMLVPILAAAKNMALNGLSVYTYMYTYPGPVCVSKALGLSCLPGKVSHADELQHLFDHPFFGANNAVAPNSEHEIFSKRLVKLWTGFADTGVPNLTWDDTTWTAAEVDNDGQVKLEILEINGVLKKVGFEQFQDSFNFWAKILDEE